MYYSDGDPAATQINTWTQWSIPLEDFTDPDLDLSDIQNISIGVGTKGDMSTAGGEGILFFDDIRLHIPVDPNDM